MNFNDALERAAMDNEEYESDLCDIEQEVVLEEKYADILTDLLEYNKIDVMDSEIIVHCLSHSFNNRSYRPKWAVSNKGRVYSLCDNHWLIPTISGKCWTVGGGSAKNKYTETAYVHKLVADYFCNPSIVTRYGESNIDVHHINNYRIPARFYSDNVSGNEKIAECMNANCAINLRYELHSIHISDHNMMKGKKAKSDYLEPDPLSRLLLNQGRCEDREKAQIWRDRIVSDMPDYDNNNQMMRNESGRVILHPEEHDVVHVRAVIGKKTLPNE